MPIGGGEITPEVALACLRAPNLTTAATPPSRGFSRSVLLQLVQQTPKGKNTQGMLLTVQDWLALTFGDKELFTVLSSQGFWLHSVGFKLTEIMGPPDVMSCFSALSLAIRIQREQFAGGAWTHALLCDYSRAYDSLPSTDPSEGGGGAGKNDKNDKKNESKDAKYYTPPWMLSKVCLLPTWLLSLPTWHSQLGSLLGTGGSAHHVTPPLSLPGGRSMKNAS